MKRAAILSVVLLTAALTGCAATELRTTEPVTPTTYTAPGVRAAESIGRLGRLAVMEVELHREADAEEQALPEWQLRSDELKRQLQDDVTAYLTETKGYDARAVNSAIPVGEMAMRDAGQRLGVDGIVTVERRIAKYWNAVEAIGNVFLMNIPLIIAFNTVNLRISIHETASGRLVWQKEMKGTDALVRGGDVVGALSDLENAVPAQLRR